MPERGKVDAEFFAEHIYPHLGAERPDVSMGPAYGVDFGTIEIGGQALAVATDPVSLVPALGFERAAWLAFHVCVADVAVSGLAPSHLAVSFTLPPAMTDEEFATVWRTVDREARDLGMAVVAGHTARYAGCSYPWVGGATVLGRGDPDDLVRPDGARPGDRVLVTKGPGVEATGLLTTLFGDRMALADDDLTAARERFDDISPVRDAMVAAAAGPVTTMHDATEGGLRGALVEVARAADVRIDYDPQAAPLLPGVGAFCEAEDLDPWAITSEGTLVICVRPHGAGAVLDALQDEGVPAADIGAVSDGEGVYAEGEPVSHPGEDASWRVWERFASEAGVLDGDR